MTSDRKVSRPVTRRRCVSCEKSFTAKRRDARYCSAKCRQRATRARAGADDIDQAIDRAKSTYWGLVRRKAEAQGVSVSQVITGEAQYVDAAGNVFVRGRHVGHTSPHPAGPQWSSWGLEAAGLPWSPPTDWVHEQAEEWLVAGADRKEEQQWPQ
jgi:hypothetical protein